MAKKYFWLKLKDNFFTDKRIKKLRRVAGGDTYTLIYLKMQLLSLKNEGKLYFDGVEESFAEELSLELDESVDNVNFTIMFLKSCGLLEEVQENEFALIETMNSIGTESASAERVRKHRESKKALHCNNQVTICNTEIEIDIEKEKDKDKQLELEVNESELQGNSKLTKKEQEFFDHYNSLENLTKCKVYTDKRRKELNKFINKYGLDNIKKYLTEVNERPYFVTSKEMGKGYMKFDLFINEKTYAKCEEGGYMNTCDGYKPLTNQSQNNGYGQDTQSTGAPSNIYQGFEMWVEE